MLFSNGRPPGGTARSWPLLFLFLCCSGFLLAQGITTKRNYIRVDQFGYLPTAKKVAVIANAQNGFNSAYGINLDVNANVQLRRVSDNAVVRQGKARAWNGGATDGYSGDKGWWWDFSAYTTPGNYYLRVTETGGNTVNSNRFWINKDVYDVVLKKAVNMFYYQRCDTDKNGSYASGANWTDGKWYTQDAETRYLYDGNNRKDMRGGWIDAGDPNKYITFAAPVVHNLLTSYETHPGLWDNLSLDLPESGNNVPDLLDEVKFEMDWIRRMQASNGGVHIKMGILDDSGYRNPPSGDNRVRYFEEVCPSASVVAAGMMAHAANAFNGAGVFGDYAGNLRTRAENAWNYYENSGDKAKECDEGRIEAGDADGDYGREHLAEATVAAVYLYQLTGKAKYNNFVKANFRQCRPFFVGTGSSEWAEYRAHQGEALLNYTKLSNADGATKTAILDLKKSNAKSTGAYYSVREADNLYRARAFYLNWGSNSLMSRNGSDNMDFINYDLNGGNHGKHRERAQAIVNYMHGVNPFGMTYLSNMYGEGAELCADEMWHTWFTDGSAYDGTHSGRVGPPPGFLSGGAQTGDYYLPMRVGNNNFNTGTTNQPSQKRWSAENGYASNRAPWAFNEPAIYYQASYVKLLADVIADGGGGGNPPPPPPPATADDIESTTVPSSWTPGQTIEVKVNYSASASRDVIVRVELDQSPWTRYADEQRQRVGAGSGQLTFNIPIYANCPVANDAYQVQTFIAPAGGSWGGRLDNLRKANLDCVAPPSGPSTSNTWIYRDNLSNNWANWSWGGTTTVRDAGVKKNGTHAFKHYAGGGGSASMRHTNGFTTTGLNSVRFWVRSWDSNYSSSVQARWNDDDGNAGVSFSVSPTWRQVTIPAADLQTGWIKRLVWTVPTGKTLFLDDVRLVYNTSGRATVEQRLTGLDPFSGPDLRVFPNPNDGAFTVDLDLPESAEPGLLELLDLNGRVIERSPVTPGPRRQRFRVDYRRHGLPAGVYILRLAATNTSPALVRRVSIRR